MCKYPHTCLYGKVTKNAKKCEKIKSVKKVKKIGKKLKSTCKWFAFVVILQYGRKQKQG